jgi:hypothetical protein
MLKHAHSGKPLNIGTELAKFGKKYGGLEIEIIRDQYPSDFPIDHPDFGCRITAAKANPPQQTQKTKSQSRRSS